MSKRIRAYDQRLSVAKKSRHYTEDDRGRNIQFKVTVCLTG